MADQHPHAICHCSNLCTIPELFILLFMLRQVNCMESCPTPRPASQSSAVQSALKLLQELVIAASAV